MQPCLVHDVAAQEVQQQQQQRELASKAQDMIPTAVAASTEAATATSSCRSTVGQFDTDTAVCNPLALHSSLQLNINFSDYDLDLDHLVPDPTLDNDQTLDTWQVCTDLDCCDGVDDSAGIADFCQTNVHETPHGHSNSRGSVKSVHVQPINKATAVATPCVEINDVWLAAKEASMHMAAVQEQQAVQQQQQQQQQQQPDKLSGPSSVMNLQPQPQPPSLTMQAQQTAAAAAAAAGSSTTTTFLVPAGGSVRLSDLLTPDICANAHLALQQRLNAAYHAGYVEGVDYCQQQVRRQQQWALTAAKSKQKQKQKGLKRDSCDNSPDACFKTAKKKIVQASPAASLPTQAAAAAAACVSQPERRAKDVRPVAAAGGDDGSVGNDGDQLHTFPCMTSFLTVDKQEAATKLKNLTDKELLMLAAQVVKQSAQVP